MSYTHTDEDIDLIFQHHQEVYSRIDLLNSNMKAIDSLEGISIDASIDIDANADVRRSYSGTIVLGEHTQISQYSVSDWIDKFVRIYIGLKSQRTLQVKWYPLGLFVFNSNGFQYDAATRTVSISCVDLIAKLNGTLAGALTGSATIFKGGTDGGSIRTAIVETLKLAGFNKYFVEYFDRTIPYDLEFGTGATYWEILTQLRDLYYPYEMYFDDDVFYCKEIPSCKEDAVVLDNTIFDKLVVSEDTSVDYSEVKNCVEIWGASINSDAHATSVSYESSQNLYTLTINENKLRNNAKFSFTINSNNPSGCKFKVNATVGTTTSSTNAVPLYKTINGNDKAIEADTMISGRTYVIKYYNKDGVEKFYYMGQTDVHAMAMLVDEVPSDVNAIKEQEACENMKFIVASDPNNTLDLYNSPFTIEKIGRRNNICSGGDYEAIYTDELALERAEYELWKTSRLTDSIQVTTLLVPWLDVNKKVSYIPKYTLKTTSRKFEDNMPDPTPAEYIIKKISISLSNSAVGTMDITMSKFYPYYPYIIDK